MGSRAFVGGIDAADGGLYGLDVRVSRNRLAQQVEQLLESRNLRAITGDAPGGEEVTDEIVAQIDDSDAVITLLTGRDALVGGGWTTHPFCVDELKRARRKDHPKPAIALVEDGVALGGLYQEHGYISTRLARRLVDGRVAVPASRRADIQGVIRFANREATASRRRWQWVAAVR